MAILTVIVIIVVYNLLICYNSYLNVICDRLVTPIKLRLFISDSKLPPASKGWPGCHAPAGRDLNAGQQDCQTVVSRGSTKQLDGFSYRIPDTERMNE